MKIGLYGGSFDPVHHGHLILARAALEELGLEKIIFIPAAISPHKLHSFPTPPEVRWEMLTTAIANEPGFAADDLELRREGASFTYDTGLAYRNKFPTAEIVYLIGADNLAALDTWYRIEDLQKIVTFAVLGRSDLPVPEFYLRIHRRFDVSASQIRRRVGQGKSIRYLVPKDVEAIITRDKLYLA